MIGKSYVYYKDVHSIHVFPLPPPLSLPPSLSQFVGTTCHSVITKLSSTCTSLTKTIESAIQFNCAEIQYTQWTVITAAQLKPKHSDITHFQLSPRCIRVMYTLNTQCRHTIYRTMPLNQLINNNN